jgi:CubicO group peptidase (beta-lactamase class C family)
MSNYFIMAHLIRRWLILSFIPVCLCSQAQIPAAPSFIRDSLDDYIQGAMKDWNVPGLAVCILKDGKAVLVKGYGVKKAGGTDKVDENTLFMIGSNSKLFTATLLATLDYEKKLSLDDKVQKWMPGFQLNNKAAGEQAIIRDLLCHRLGFMTFQGDFTYWTSNLTRSEVIEKMSHIRAHYPFRTTWGYTNAAFLTAGQIIPAVTGISWEQTLRDRIFKPLGMSRSLALSAELPSAPNKAVPHTYSNGSLVAIPFCQIDNLAPAGSISSSASDLSKWIQMQLDSGRAGGSQVVPWSAIRQTRKPHSIISDGGPQYNKGHFLLYGLGVELQEYQEREIVSHTGGVNGFVSSVKMVPDEKLGIVVLTNTDANGLFEALTWEILDAYLGLPFRNYSRVFLESFKRDTAAMAKQRRQLEDSVAMNIQPDFPLDTYTGNYVNDVYGNIHIARQNQALQIHFSHHPNLLATLKPVGGNRFFAEFNDPEFGTSVFTFGVKDGKPVSLHLKVADFIEIDPYEFRKLP